MGSCITQVFREKYLAEFFYGEEEWKLLRNEEFPQPYFYTQVENKNGEVIAKTSYKERLLHIAKVVISPEKHFEIKSEGLLSRQGVHTAIDMNGEIIAVVKFRRKKPKPFENPIDRFHADAEVTDMSKETMLLLFLLFYRLSALGRGVGRMRWFY